MTLKAVKLETIFGTIVSQFERPNDGKELPRDP